MLTDLKIKNLPIPTSAKRHLTARSAAFISSFSQRARRVGRFGIVRSAGLES